jgi:hypothetical protein
LVIFALLFLPAVCLAQVPGACLPNACGPVQAIPPLPQPHFQPAPQPHFEVNPWNFAAPIITNFATAPRYVTNPATGQMELRTPGQWVQPAPGQWAWNALPVWPLAGKAPQTEKPKPERIRPLRRLVIHLHLL